MTTRIALITGANKGIGFELARQLGKAGVMVILCARDLTKGKQAAEQLLKEGITVDPQELDVTHADHLKRLVAYVEKTHGKLDFLVNNAGIFSDPTESILTVTPENIERVMATNTFAPLLITQAFAPLLEKSDQGRVLNISSGLGQLNDMDNQYAAYSISKTALNAVTRQLAGALMDAGVTVNTICPGWVRTDMGGPNAERSPEQSVNGIAPLLLNPKEKRTGCFLRDGQEIPW